MNYAGTVLHGVKSLFYKVTGGIRQVEVSVEGTMVDSNREACLFEIL